MTMKKVVLMLAALACSATAQPHQIVSLALVGDSRFSFGRTMSDVPMLLVPMDELALYPHVHINSVSDTQPLVTCQPNRYTTLDAVPAVRVVLKDPVMVQSPEAYLPFPSELSVVHEGLRMNVPVGALVVPMASHDFQGPMFVRVMYAVPAGPLQLQYPVYSENPVPYPLRPEYAPSTTQTQIYNSRPTSYRPSTPFRPVTSYRPTVPSYADLGHNDIYGPRRPRPPVVTVLNFPSEIASPETLFYQPPIDESGELGNRNPPEAVIPAGIVQSSQPRPTLQLFLNSKEHPLLQALRDESENNRNKVAANSISVGVEAL